MSTPSHLQALSLFFTVHRQNQSRHLADNKRSICESESVSSSKYLQSKCCCLEMEERESFWHCKLILFILAVSRAFDFCNKSHIKRKEKRSHRRQRGFQMRFIFFISWLADSCCFRVRVSFNSPPVSFRLKLLAFVYCMSCPSDPLGRWYRWECLEIMMERKETKRQMHRSVIADK